MPDDGIDRDPLMEITVVVNGSLDMGPGKEIGQAFQAAFRYYVAGTNSVLFRAWLNDGTRTIVRRAKTPAIFERVCQEVPGWIMRDEGFTEVDTGTATLFVSTPYPHRDRPKLLENKKVPLYVG